MRKIVLLIGALALLQSCGPSLPKPANEFIKTYFPQAKVQEVEKEDHNGGFEAKLSDKTEIKFDQAGNWTQVDGEDGNTIPTGFFPQSIDDYVRQKGFLIEGIKKTNTGYKVDLIGSHTDLYFNHNGDLIGNY
ncbi:hypothetical protein HMPREF9075_00295 [Capnocytophaga sp. oral taxon 332 str. F0381]|jgi:hypothetical protein|uniref:PepSY-like domain-containing protein n=1 Tax=Capnocytophaga sp. oral taxon 332 TaxID=712213 RepID=UPI0002A2903C|nr:PepSY-like domain-containing protein [Capnocytophaga sp. oral taxon 332]EKY12580.1 hypothetical protein HMPREF9075_00295 [Capnocytophaga sp. oral taxon 332 str. F0381]